MPKVDVDLRKMIGTIISSLPGKGDTQKILKALTASARAEWISLASDEFTSTGRDYIQGIGEAEITESSGTIRLDGKLPNMLEQGWPKTDMRTTILNSPHVKTSKAGNKYMAVPFRHGTPGTSGRNVGPPMPRAIHNVARNLAATIRGEARAKVEKQMHNLQPKGMGIKVGKAARKLLEIKSKPWHSGSIYAGMIKKMEKDPGTKGPSGQPQYQTFRTISEGVPEGWKHPGLKARNLAQKVQDHIRDVADQIVSDAL